MCLFTKNKNRFCSKIKYLIHISNILHLYNNIKLFVYYKSWNVNIICIMYNINKFNNILIMIMQMAYNNNNKLVKKEKI